MNIQARIDEGRMVVEALLSKQPISFKDMNSQTIPAERGIYAIKNCSTKQFLYAGKSERLQRRIWEDHRSGNAQSDLAQILVNDKEISAQKPAQARGWMEDHCVAYCMTTSQLSMDIKWAEHFVIAVLRPIYNKQ